MAQRVEVKLIDDLDGGDAAETVSFSLDGISYEIDLSDKHAKKLRDEFAAWTGHARRSGTGARAARDVARRRAAAPSAPTSARCASGPGPTATRCRTAAASRPRCRRPTTRPTDREQQHPRGRPGGSPPGRSRAVRPPTPAHRSAPASAAGPQVMLAGEVAVGLDAGQHLVHARSCTELATLCSALDLGPRPGRRGGRLVATTQGVRADRRLGRDVLAPVEEDLAGS